MKTKIEYDDGAYYRWFRTRLEQAIINGKKDFVIYPFGHYGLILKQVMNEQFGIEEAFIIDNKLSQFNSKIKSLEYLKHINPEKYTYLITSKEYDVMEALSKYVHAENIFDMHRAVNEDEDVRVEVLRLMAQRIREKSVEGECAEAGVYKGEFAKYINKFLPDKKLYLFDTFEGFNNNRLKENVDKVWKASMDGYAAYKGSYFVNDSIEEVLSKMKNKDNCIIKKGFFPETAKGLDENFCFVSLDMDIYQSTYDGLAFFWPKLEKGGVIMIHDYNNYRCPGVKKAVDEYCNVNGISFVCLPDTCGSVVLIK